MSGPLTSVTSDGNYQLSPDASVFIDPPPHDKAYFEAHLAGMAEYWNSMSNGMLTVEYRVVPEGDNDAYFLSDMAAYGPGSSGFWTLESMISLTQDMIVAADVGTQQDGSANLADYDDDDPMTTIIFVHAGGDWQGDINADSPNDIPSYYMTMNEPIPLTSVDGDTGVPGLLSEASVIPETTSQDGYLGSIAALLANRTGRALGLPDLFDTMTGLPSVGVWDLMDSGINVVSHLGFYTPEGIVLRSVTGLLPTSIGIWSKHYLGWVVADVVDAESREVELLTAHLPTQPADGCKVIEIVLDDDRRLLLENRWVPYLNENCYMHADPATGVVQYIAKEDGTNSHYYDYFLPSAGLLAWHVRQDLVAERMATNTLQQGADRAVELIEADGSQDIGVEYGYVGSDDDAFRDVSWFEGPYGGYHWLEATSTHLGASHGIPEVFVSGIPGSWGTTMSFRVSDWPVAVPDSLVGRGLPSMLKLYPNQPNPFNPQTTIKYDVPVDGRVTLRVYDVRGALVRSVIDADLPRGSHQAIWDGRDSSGRVMASGSYYARLEAGGKVESVRMSLVR